MYEVYICEENKLMCLCNELIDYNNYISWRTIQPVKLELTIK